MFICHIRTITVTVMILRYLTSLLRVYLPNNRYQCKSGVELGLSKTDFEVVSDIKKCEFIFSYTHIEFCLDKVCYLIE